MSESDIEYNVIFRSDCSEDLENFLVSYNDNGRSKLHIVDFSEDQQYCKSKQLLDDFGFSVEPSVIRMNYKNPLDFRLFKELMVLDRDYSLFDSNYLIFCFGGQLFDDTLDVLVTELKQNKCLTVSPVSVDFEGNFYDFDQFNPNCFGVNKRYSQKVIDYSDSFSEFVDAAKFKKMSMLMSNSMVFG